jgi:2Fe-2S ferredoxin
MVSVLFRLADGAEQRITARTGDSLMQSAKANDVPGILADCGGACACATCHVVVEEDWYPRLEPPATHERDMLEFALDAQPTSSRARSRSTSRSMASSFRSPENRSAPWFQKRIRIAQSDCWPT